MSGVCRHHWHRPAGDRRGPPGSRAERCDDRLITAADRHQNASCVRRAGRRSATSAEPAGALADMVKGAASGMRAALVELVDTWGDGPVVSSSPAIELLRVERIWEKRTTGAPRRGRAGSGGRGLCCGRRPPAAATSTISVGWLAGNRRSAGCGGPAAPRSSATRPPPARSDPQLALDRAEGAARPPKPAIFHESITDVPLHSGRARRCGVQGR